MKHTLSILFLAALSMIACKQPNTITETSPLPVNHNSQEELARKTTKTNWLLPPYKYWSIKNMDKLFDVGVIEKKGEISSFEKGAIDLTGLKIEQFDGKVYGFEEHLDSNRTDGFLVLHQGKVIYEKYFGNMTENTTHNWFSVSKSLTGTTAAILAYEGLIDLQKPIVEYLPELRETAWDGPTVQQAMNMEVNIKFDEIYLDPRSDAYKFSRVTRFVVNPKIKPEFDSVIDYFKSVKRGNNTRELFHYVSLNTEVIGMIISKVTGKQPSKVISEKIWSKIGAEQDAFVVRDPNGYEMVSAAINSTLRDAGRFGQLMLNDGYFMGQQIVPRSVVKSIEKGGSVAKFAESKRGKVFTDFHYTNQWWHTDKEAYFAKGLFGQWIYIDPSTETVIVKFTTSDIPTSTEYDWINNMNLMEEIVGYLSEVN